MVEKHPNTRKSNLPLDHCVRCKQPNYSSIVFNSQSCTDNNNLSESPSRVDCTQQSLSFTSDSKIMIGKPLHQSTPTKAPRSPKPKAISEATPLTILNVNCQSVKSKVPQFINLVESTEPDIVLGTESWLSSDIHDSECFQSGYSVYRKDRNVACNFR